MNALTRGHGVVAAIVMGVCAAQAWAQPANDNCSGGVAVAEGTFDFDLTGAGNSVQSTCDDPGAGLVPDVWFNYRASGNGTAIVSTCGLTWAGAGTTISVYANCGSTTPLACNSNACGDGQSTVVFAVTSGTHYRVRLASSDGQTFAGQFQIMLVAPCTTPGAGAPANDCCATATAVGNGRFAFTTAGATRDYAGACDQLNPNPDVWFSYTAPTTGFSRIRPDADAPQDLGFTVLDGACGGLQVACGADFLRGDDTRQLVWATVAGHRYLIRLHGVSDPVATGHVIIGTATPPTNDECTTAMGITGTGMFPYDNTLANNSGPDDNPDCDFGIDGISVPGISHDVWFRWTSNLPVGQDATVSTCGGSAVDTKMAVYADGCPVGTPIDCNDDYCFLQSRVRFTPTPGAAYLIRIGDWPGAGNQPGPDGKPGIFTIEAVPTCNLAAPAGAMMEPEACGAHVNDGCDVGAYTDVPCGTTTIFGTAPVVDGVQDIDYYRLVLPVATHVRYTGTAEFPMRLAILNSDCPLGVVAQWRFASEPCQDPELEPLEADLEAGTYYFGVANTKLDSLCGGKNNYIVTIHADACEPSGRCCVHAACSVTTQSACAAAHGTYGGDGSVCPPPGGNYVSTACGEALEDISASGAPGPVCNDCGQLVNIGFPFVYYGQAYTTVHVSSNGFLTFSDTFYDGAVLGVTLPSPFIQAVVAPWWDDFYTDAGSGQIFTATVGVAPNRRFVVMWKTMEKVGVPGSSSTFEAALYEGSNRIAFRYGTLDPSNTATVAVTSADGLVAAVLDQGAIGSCVGLALTSPPNPCCPADFNDSGAVSVQDIFDFLSAYFSGDPRADVNGAGGVTVQDIFDYLGMYFGGC